MATFSKKAYIQIADLLKQEAVVGVTKTTFIDGIFIRSNLINQLANLFARDNPAFDREHFLSACGL